MRTDLKIPQEVKPLAKESKASDAPQEQPKKKKKKHGFLRFLAVFLTVVLFLEGCYCFVVFTDISVIRNLREKYIETALSTMSHQWLAKAIFPSYMVDEVQARMYYQQMAQAGHKSERPTVETSVNEDGETIYLDPTDTTDPTDTAEQSDPLSITDEESFYSVFWELSRTSFEDYCNSHPAVLKDGWENIYINRAGIEDTGTDIYTTMGEQVLAIDAKNRILLLRVRDTGYIGVLAVAKDPAQLRCCASSGIGDYGEDLDVIVRNNDGLLGITASGFYDPNGGGTGGEIAGYAMCDGKEYGPHYDSSTGYKRIELTRDNKMYITDTVDAVQADVTDAVEFSPALIIDGELMVGGFYGDWSGINPRACIGQSESGEILMLVIEGRQTTRSIGADVETCANILKRHKGYTAMNMDGGTSAVMWYNGEYVTKCSNRNLHSRYLPNAWVYGHDN